MNVNPEQQSRQTESVAQQVQSTEVKDLTPQQQEAREQIDSLKKELETLDATVSFSKKTSEILYKGLMWDPSIKDDPEAKPTIIMFEKFKKIYEKAAWEQVQTKNQLADLVSMWDKIEHTAWIDMKNWKVEELKYSSEDMKDISNKEFLSLQPEERLQYITTNNIDSENIASGDVKNLEFTFTFDGEFNEHLYLLTTAGQSLPKEVWTVEENGVIYTRNWLKWEFFNWNDRLTIHEWTDLNINWLRNEGDIKKMTEWFNERLDWYPKNQHDIVLWCLERNINPELPLLILERKLNWIEVWDESRNYIIEDFLTEFDRIKPFVWEFDWESVKDNWKYPDDFALTLIKSINIPNWKDIAKDYWIEESKIKSIWTWVLNFEKIVWWDLSNIDFRGLRSKYPNEASIKNNNPAWLTWNSTFANTLKSHGIEFYKWTSRPSSEWWNYFWFENMEEWINAFNLLWEIKLKKMSNKTFWDFAKNWAVDYKSYQSQFWDVWNKKLSSLDEWYIDVIKSKQMRIESPGMHKELSKLGVVV